MNDGNGENCKNNEDSKNNMDFTNGENCKSNMNDRSDKGGMNCKNDMNCKNTTVDTKKLQKDEVLAESQSIKINNFKNTKHELQRGDSSLRRRAASYMEIKAQKLDLLEKVVGKSSCQTERLLCESDPEIYQIKEKARYLNKDQVEIKLTLNKSSFDNLERLKSLLSQQNTII